MNSKVNALLIPIIIIILSPQLLLAERVLKVTSSGEAVVRGDYLIRYGWFDKNGEGGLTHISNHDAPGKIDLKHTWKDSVDTFLEYRHVPFSQYHNQKAPISTLKTFVGGEKLDLYGLQFGLYRVPRSQGEVWTDGLHSARKSFIHFEVGQDIQLIYDISWDEQPDFIQIAAFGHRDDKIEANWICEDGSREATSFPVWTGDFRRSKPVKDFWQRLLFHTQNHYEGFNPSPDDVERGLEKYYNHSFLNTFKRRSLSVKLSFHHSVSHADSWHLDGGMAGIVVRPVYVDSFHPYSPKDKDVIVDMFRETDDPYRLIAAVGGLLDYIHKGWLPAAFTMEIRDEVLKRLKKRDGLALKEILSQLARIVLRYQERLLVPEIENQVTMATENVEEKRGFIDWISKLEKRYLEKGDRSVEEIREIVSRELKQYLDQAAFDQKRMVNLADALSAFLDRKETVSFEEICREIEKMKTPSLGGLEKMIKEGDMAALREKFRGIRDSLRVFISDSKQDVEIIRNLYQDLQGRYQKVSPKDIQGKFEKLREAARAEIEAELKQEEDLKVKLDLIRTDQKIFESDMPWEKLD